MAARRIGKPAPEVEVEREVEIHALGGRGDGIGQADGFSVFVPYAAPGDRLRVRLGEERDGGRAARIVARLADGADRAEPPCPYFGDCGGCSLQHIRRPAYLAWKQGLIGQALARHGISAEIAPMISVPPGSRRRADFVAERRGRQVLLGFNATGSRRVVDLSSCLILLPQLVALMAPLREALGKALGAERDADVAVTSTDTGIDLWLKTRRFPDLAGRQALIDLAERCDLARVSAGLEAEPIVIRRLPRVVFAGHPVAMPPDGFLQPSAPGEAVLTRIVVDALAGKERIADLYAGCGTFSLPLAAQARIHAVEGNAAAVAALSAATRGLAGRFTTERRDLAREPVTRKELAKFDAVLFDPPRAGASTQSAEIAGSRLDRAIAVSCHPGSFARDARILVDGGFRLEWVKPVDQFPWSAHLELVGFFQR